MHIMCILLHYYNIFILGICLCVQCIFILSGAHRCMLSDINGDAKSIGTNGLTSGICSDVLFFSYALYLMFSLLYPVKRLLYIHCIHMYILFLGLELDKFIFVVCLFH